MPCAISCMWSDAILLAVATFTELACPIVITRVRPLNFLRRTKDFMPVDETVR